MTKQTTGRGIFIFGRESLVMRKWQVLEFDGTPYYAFVPDGNTPIKEEEIPEYPDDVNFYISEEDDEPIQEVPEVEEPGEDIESEPETMDIKPVIVNGKVQEPALSKIQEPPKVPLGDLYQVKVEAGIVTLEKLNVESVDASKDNIDDNQYDDETQDFPEFEGIDEDEDQIIEEDREEQSDEEDEEDKDQNMLTIKCKVCGEAFDSTLSFRKHVAWTHKKKIYIQESGTYICCVCDFRTSKKNQFAAHLQRKHETYSRVSKRQGQTGAVFPCQACGFVCRSKHSLQSHFIRKHTDRYEHNCNFCSKKFKVKGDLTNHIRFHHKEKPVNCDVCGKLCLNSGSLYVHQKWAHYKPKFECPICKRRMVTQENLDQHMVQQHEKREKIVCAECGKTFTKKDSFKRHMAVHTGSKPYNCVICNKPFARRSQLRQHLLIHTGKRPFVCDICGKAFTQKPGLICHRKTHPGKHPPLPVMPIGDIVKEFTENYLAIHAPGKKQEGLDDDVDDPETEEDEEIEEEEYYEEVEEEILEDVDDEKMEQ